MERTAPLDVIAASLRRERERHGISLAELARRANLAKSTLSQLERASATPASRRSGRSPSRLDVPFSRLVDPRKRRFR
jgi:transcriptional regulator with XRE-family HTH domain